MSGLDRTTHRMCQGYRRGDIQFPLSEDHKGHVVHISATSRGQGSYRCPSAGRVLYSDWVCACRLPPMLLLRGKRAADVHARPGSSVWRAKFRSENCWMCVGTINLLRELCFFLRGLGIQCEAAPGTILQ